MGPTALVCVFSLLSLYCFDESMNVKISKNKQKIPNTINRA